MSRRCPWVAGRCPLLAARRGLSAISLDEAALRQAQPNRSLGHKPATTRSGGAVATEDMLAHGRGNSRMERHVPGSAREPSRYAHLTRETSLATAVEQTKTPASARLLRGHLDYNGDCRTTHQSAGVVTVRFVVIWAEYLAFVTTRDSAPALLHVDRSNGQ